MPPPSGVVASARHRLASAGTSLPSGLRHAVQRHRIEASQTLPRLSEAPVRARLREAAAMLDGLAGRLRAGDPRAVLARGYALVTDRAGHPVMSAAAVPPTGRLRLEFADGSVEVQRAPEPLAKRQGSLAI